MCEVKRSKACKVALFLAVAAVLLATAGVATAAEPKKIKIGLLYSQSGPLASIGELCMNGHKFAADRINAKGGIKSLGGAQLEFVVGDAESKPQVAMSAVEKLITKDNVAAIMGPFASGLSFAATQIAEKYKTPIIIPIAVADKITERGFKYTFRCSMKASQNARDSLNFLKWLGKKTGKEAKTVALLTEDTLWGQSSAKAWKAMMPEYGYKIVAELSYSKTTQDVSPTIAKLKAAKPDVVLQISYTPDAILITRTMFDQNFNCMGRLPSGGGHTDPRFVKALGKMVNFIMINRLYDPSIKGPGDKNQRVNAEYKKKYGYDMDDYSGPAYDATWVLADALERAGSTDRKKIRDALATTNLEFEKSETLRPFTYKFDKTGQAPAETVFAQYQDQKSVFIYPEKYAAGKPVWPMPTWKERGLR
jgi:branched-chain amino acid transport system substrate-binding protein